MSNTKLGPSKWRLNYVITYLDKNAASGFRDFVHDALTSAATLRRIDYAMETESPLFDDIRNSLSTPLQGIVADLVYFRSSPNSLSSIKEFRSLIDGLFHGYDVILGGDSFDVHALLQNTLKQHPFPEEFFRPLSYPYVEHHNGKDTNLCVPYSTVQKVLDETDESVN